MSDNTIIPVPTVQLFRNATLKINYAGKTFLLDPMFSDKGMLPSFAGISQNPTVGLPFAVATLLQDIDYVLVSHTHPDHFDTVAAAMLGPDIPVLIQPDDIAFFKEQPFKNVKTITDKVVIDDVTIYRTSGKHGKGKVLEKMGTISGFVFQATGYPTLYIVGDSIWNEEIRQNCIAFNPDYIVVNSGGAILPPFAEDGPIIMDEEQVIALMEEASEAKVIAVHMEALDHCRVTRNSLRAKANEKNITPDRLLIPNDGETIRLQ